MFGSNILLHALKNKKVASGVTLIHGILAIAALILLTIIFMDNPKELYPVLGLFWLVAMAGVSNLALDVTNRKPSKVLAFLHTGLAMIAFLLLIFLK